MAYGFSFGRGGNVWSNADGRTGVVKRWPHENHLAISWDQGVGLPLLRLGFVRLDSNGLWQPVVQHKAGRLIPMSACPDLHRATQRVIRYHRRRDWVVACNRGQDD